MDPTDPDLSAFANHGGKLLLFYGTADTCVSIYRTAQYFDSVKQRMGAQNVARFARFLVSPHVGHEMNGPGPDAIDLVTAMDAWVERGVAPDHLVVAKRDPQSNDVALERPACEFPKFARYDGSGDPPRRRVSAAAIAERALQLSTMRCVCEMDASLTNLGFRF